MHDTIIRAGTVVDGTGEARRTADVAIRDGLIVEIGKVSGPARQEIDADGALVTPGFVDLHTHYDGQFLWDDTIDPSFSHGLTTVIGGNCGVGFAPAHPDFRKQLIELMEGVEDIPDVVLDEGLDWNWRTFEDYFDRLDQRRYALDVTSHLTHAPLRVFVMGERALRQEPATPEDIAAMAGHVRAAMQAGAAGFSTGRLVEHISTKGANVYGTFAEEAELHSLARAMGESGRGVFQIVPKGGVGDIMGMPTLGREGRLAEHDLYESIARAGNRPVTYSLAELPSEPDDLRMMVNASREACERGAMVHPQVAARGISGVQMLDTYHMFMMRPSYRAVRDLPLAERAAALRDPARRKAILAEEDEPGEYVNHRHLVPMVQGMARNVGMAYILNSTADYEPDEDRRISTLAAAAGKAPDAFLYDHYASGDGSNFSVSLSLNYVSGNLDHVHWMLQQPHVVSGLGDGGAHIRHILDSSIPTFQLAFWARDRSRGEQFSVEHVVRTLAAKPAALYGLNDRGILTPGRRADINVIDHERLMPGAPFVSRDLPSGGARLRQGSHGYLATLVAGQVTRRHDTDTGERPGRLVRFGQTRQ